MKTKILFICKKRKTYGNGPYTQIVSSGLLNSAKFVNDMLVENGIDSHIIEVIDNNCIDREVAHYKPTHVIIEALWVVPSKFEVLTKLHPNVKWIIRLHSEIPFIANEGIAMEWIFAYQQYKNVVVSVNSPRILKEMNPLLKEKLLYLPNFYPVRKKNHFPFQTEEQKCDDIIDIGCFGAVRPLKNHLIQAVSAIEFAQSIGKKLRFHINVTRIENNGDPVLKNIRSLFANVDHELIEHDWMNHHEFLKVIRTMDLCMQVSFSETFNIVTADAVNMNVPVIASHEISWLPSIYKANPTSSKDIIRKLKLTWFLKLFRVQWINKMFLKWYSTKSESVWLANFLEINCCDCENDCHCGCNCK